MQALGAPPINQMPGKLEQWVPQDMAQQVKMVRVKGLQGGRQVPLTRQVVGVDYRRHLARRPLSLVTSPGKAVSILCSKPSPVCMSWPTATNAVAVLFNHFCLHHID